MKKFTKLFLSCAVVAALSAAAATLASAEDVTISNGLGKYNTDNGTITLTAPEGLDTTQPVTFIAYEKPVNDSTSIDANTVVAIDQSKTGVEGADGITKNVVKGTPKVTDDGKTYIVKIGYYKAGGAFTTASGELKLSTAPVGDKIIIGDVNDDGEASSADATLILRWDGGSKDRTKVGQTGQTFTITDLQTASETFPKATVAGDVNGDEEASSADATLILRWDGGSKDRTKVGQTGVEVLGSIEEAASN